MPEAAECSVHIGGRAGRVLVLALVRVQRLLPPVQLLVPGLLRNQGRSSIIREFRRRIFARADKHAYIGPQQLYSALTELTIWQVEMLNWELHAPCSILRSCCHVKANKQLAYKRTAW